MPRRNNHFRTLFPLFVFFIVVDSKNDCLTSFCGGNKSLPIHYPFLLESSNEHQKGCDQSRAINLKCSNNNQENVPVLNLASAGDLYIRNINYSAKAIQLYDPNSCLASMFMNTSFSILPLISATYQNYTFFNCPLNATTTSSNFTAVGCLSNSTFSVSATSSIMRAQEMINSGCNMIQTVPIPVSSPLQFEYNGFSDDLLLTWDVPYCEVCGDTVTPKGRRRGFSAGLIILSILFPFWGSLVLYILAAGFLTLVKVIIKFKRFVKMRLDTLASRGRDHSSNQPQVAPIPSATRSPVVTAQPRRANIESTMNTIVVGESRRVPGPNSVVCPICLDDYNPRDTIKCSTKCEHYFHANCIDLWLSTHNSCPVCRTVAS